MGKKRSVGDVARKWKENARHKMPPILASHRAFAKKWLNGKLIQVENDTAELKAAAKGQKSDWIKGQLLWLKHGRSWIRALLKENAQRRGYGKNG